MQNHHPNTYKLNRKLEYAVITGDKKEVIRCLQQGANPNQDDLLEWAAREGHVDIIKLLLSSGADPNKTGPVSVKNSKHLDDDQTIIPLTDQCGAMPVIDLDCKGQVLSIHPGQKALNNFFESSLESCSLEHETYNTIDEENASDILCRSQHGHSHVLPTTVASLAWMVLLGDGIHNLCDGLAIGAAFSSSITGGFSTSVAIFFHELPHEIGDFAVLLKAGMTVKQALIYSTVSTVLAFIGMVIGVAIGNIGDSITWVYVSVAGMFLSCQSSPP